MLHSAKKAYVCLRKFIPAEILICRVVGFCVILHAEPDPFQVIMGVPDTRMNKVSELGLRSRDRRVYGYRAI